VVRRSSQNTGASAIRTPQLPRPGRPGASRREQQISNFIRHSLDLAPFLAPRRAVQECGATLHGPEGADTQSASPCPTPQVGSLLPHTLFTLRDDTTAPRGSTGASRAARTLSLSVGTLCPGARYDCACHQNEAGVHAPSARVATHARNGGALPPSPSSSHGRRVATSLPDTGRAASRPSLFARTRRPPRL
jgi:hypothetical protein